MEIAKILLLDRCKKLELNVEKKPANTTQKIPTKTCANVGHVRRAVQKCANLVEPENSYKLNIDLHTAENEPSKIRATEIFSSSGTHSIQDIPFAFSR